MIRDDTRVLVELVTLNIGIITPAIFTMMVLMALVTTLMTGPLLGLLVPDAYAVPRTGNQLPRHETA